MTVTEIRLTELLDEIDEKIKYYQKPENYRYIGRDSLMIIYGRIQALLDLNLISIDKYMKYNNETIGFINRHPDEERYYRQCNQDIIY